MGLREIFRTAAALLSLIGIPATAAVPTLYITGDSTVNNHSKGLLGWGDPIANYFDASRIHVENDARGGRSSRTFLTEGLWDSVLAKLQPGDFVVMQFGHNDGGALTDIRHRASLKGTGEDTAEGPNDSGQMETVHSYGWYMRRFVDDTKAKHAVPIVLSPVPRNIWENGKVVRASRDYGKWAQEAAQREGAFFIDLNEITARKYEALGPDVVKAKYFGEDHTHTTPAGAEVNAQSVVEGIRGLKDCALNNYLLQAAETR
ncbi:MAG TPA: rhamnogalacturonan acetylesterase [Bryobacteraceae bacterium]|jgi:lysophospholipase L1-like esterase|nr:rhamnogalacturonan acetylesterase [Bryobacteraceae bacterium]